MGEDFPTLVVDSSVAQALRVIWHKGQMQTLVHLMLLSLSQVCTAQVKRGKYFTCLVDRHNLRAVQLACNTANVPILNDCILLDSDFGKI